MKIEEYQAQGVLSNFIKIVKIGFCALKQHFDYIFKNQIGPAGSTGNRSPLMSKIEKQ